MNIGIREQHLYETVFSTVDSYTDGATASSPGAQHVALFCEMAGLTAKPDGFIGASVLDAGCGSGKGTAALVEAGFRVTACDITNAGLTDDLRRSLTVPFHQVCLWDDLSWRIGWRDYVYCCDVLEHIPAEFTMLVISRLLHVARRGVFLSIALVPDEFGVWVGQPLHQTVQGFTWWRDRLNTLGTIKECRDLLTAGVYYVEPKC